MVTRHVVREQFVRRIEHDKSGCGGGVSSGKTGRVKEDEVGR